MPVKVGFLPLYLKLYEDANPDSHEIFASFIQSIQNRLEACGLTVATPGVVFDAPHVEQAARLFADEDVAFVVTAHLAYSPSLLVADFLESLHLPILILDTTPEFTFEDMKADYLMRNHGIHGVMDLTSVLTSRSLDFVVVSGHPDDGSFDRKVEKAVAAFKAAVLMKNQKVAITGTPFVGMGDFAVDFAAIHDQFGTSVQTIDVDAIVTASGAIAEDAVQARIAEDGKFWDISRVSPNVYAREVRSFLAIREIFDKEGISAYTMNFQHIGEKMPTPFYACSALMSEGLGYGGEGDVLTATLGRPLNAIAEAAKFDEFFCADWKNDRILMSHMGETDSRFAKPDSAPFLAEREAMFNPNTSIIYRFQADPGEVTFANLSPVRNGGFRMVAGLLDIVDSPVLEEIGGPHYQVDTKMPVAKFLELYAAEGGGHHLYISKGDITDELSIFCKLLGFDYRRI